MNTPPINHFLPFFFVRLHLTIIKQLALCCLLVWVFIHPAAAQITITNSIFPLSGDTLHWVFGNQPGAINQVFTPPGGNQAWDLSNLQADQTWNQIMQDPQTGSVSGSFPAASVLFNPPNSGSEVYLQVTGNQANDLGYFGQDPLGFGLDLLFVKSPALEESWAPVNFFDIKQSTSNVLTAFDASIAPAVLLNLVPTADSFRIRLTFQRVSTIDAWGTLAIPGGNFDVLRKKQTEYKSTAVDVKVAPLGWIDISTIGGQQILPLGTDTITTFHFLNDASKEAIALCALNTQQNQVTSVQYKALSPTTTATFTPAINKALFIYPNPVENTLYVHFTTAEKATFQLRLISVHGAPILEQTVEASAAENEIAVPVSNLPPGVYTLVLQRDGAPAGWARVVKRG